VVLRAGELCISDARCESWGIAEIAFNICVHTKGIIINYYKLNLYL